MTEISIKNNYYPQTISCKFGENCNREDCRFSHAPTSNFPRTNISCKFGESCNREDCRFSHAATRNFPRTNKTPYIKEAQKEAIKPQNTKECAWWAIGQCTKGEACKFVHPPKKPVLTDILKYSESKFITTHVKDGMIDRVPIFPGLPALPPNGKCRIMDDQNLIIYFIPFFKPIGGVVYYKKIRLYRFNKKKGEYKLVFNYTKQAFHITSAAASNGYLVCSRLPYDAAVLNIMEEAKKLKKKNEYFKKKDEMHAKQMAQLRAKNRDLSDKYRKPLSTLRVETKIRIDTRNNNRLENLSLVAMDNFRSADPVDLFVFDSELKVHVHVLEYHKPADFVDLRGKEMCLWDKKTGMYHTFILQLQTQNVSKYQFDEPIQPKQLCDVF
jgi:hypothetical protein